MFGLREPKTRILKTRFSQWASVENNTHQKRKNFRWIGKTTNNFVQFFTVFSGFCDIYLRLMLLRKTFATDTRPNAAHTHGVSAHTGDAQCLVLSVQTNPCLFHFDSRMVCNALMILLECCLTIIKISKLFARAVISRQSSMVKLFRLWWCERTAKRSWNCCKFRWKWPRQVLLKMSASMQTNTLER